MIRAPSDLKLQVWLYILAISSFLAGLTGLIGYAWQLLPVPESLMLTAESAVALVLGGVILLSLVARAGALQVLSGGILLALAGFSLFRDLHTGGAWLDQIAAASVMLLASVAVVGVHSRRGRLWCMLAGATGLLIGGYAFFVHVSPGHTLGSGEAVLGFSRVTSLFCFSFGASLMALGRLPAGVTFGLGSAPAVIGALSVAGTFVLVALATWGVHLERHQAAQAVAHHHAAMLARELTSSVQLMSRQADRWSALELDIPASLRSTEMQRYFADIPALVSLLVRDAEGHAFLHKGKTAEDSRWLTRMLDRRDVAQWVDSVRGKGLGHGWLMPDSRRALFAILVIAPEWPGAGMFVSVFDIELLLQPMLHPAGDEFGITIQPQGGDVDLSFAGHRREPDVHERVTVVAGPDAIIGITATGGPLNLFSLRGALTPAILSLGLLVSYLLTMAKSLALIQRQSSRELSVEEQRLRSLFFQSPNAVFEFSREGHYVSMNAEGKAITGIAGQDLGKITYRELLTEELMVHSDYRAFDIAFGNALSGVAQTFSVGFLNVQRIMRDYECSFVPILVDGVVVGLYAVVKDVTERFLALETQRLLTKSLESSDSAVLVVDVRKTDMPAVFVNSAFAQMTGYAREDVLYHSLSAITAPLQGSDDLARIQEAVDKGEASSLVVKSYRRDGTPFWNQLSVAPVKNEHGVVTHCTAFMKDVTEQREQEDQLAYQATHDVLTGLANRSLFEDRLEHDIALARHRDEQLAVLFIDLDEFKPINDALGHRVGDEVLVSVARRLEAIIRPTDTLARFGGDEYVLLLPTLQSVQEAERIAQRILDEIGEPHRVGAHELYVSASIGIGMLPDQLELPGKLLQLADMAMYKAKKQGRDAYVVYSDDLDKKLSKRVTLRNELQEAIKTNQLLLNYQPQVDRHGRLCGLEALVRWRHPDKGMIPPSEFIPIAEETGQIVHLGRWVTTQACVDAKTLLNRGILQGRMAVNLSPLQFHRAGFLQGLRDILEQTGLPAARLELELTEGILMRNSEGATDILRALEEMGITTSIDDFGTGYSSFGYLKDFRVESVKIDKSFVDSVVSNRKNAAVCKGVITMAREMGIKVIAEGVETREQLELLIHFGCDVFQGYYIARPMPFDTLVSWMKLNRDNPSLL